jgi:mono/diheme cytochrome c family protein
MKRSILGVGVLLMAGAVAFTGGQSVSAQSGVYTAAQAERGMGPAVNACGSCHGQELTGGDFAPGIVGEDFIGRWAGESLDVLVTKVTQTMPLDRPGALSAEEYSDIVAYMLQASGVAAGDAEFDIDAPGNADATVGE